jgi:hypothetical protein
MEAQKSIARVKHALILRCPAQPGLEGCSSVAVPSPTARPRKPLARDFTLPPREAAGSLPASESDPQVPP